MIISVIISAILPAIVLVFYIYHKDKLQPEPPKELIKGFGWGMLSVVVALCLAEPFATLWWKDIPENSIECIYKAFFEAAIPEECAKALCLYLFLRKNRYFDEYMDGIVYAVTIGMGFAGLENIFYLLGNIEDWIAVGISRGIYSVPGHFFVAVLMGYFFSLWRIDKKQAYFIKMLVYPIVAHGLFDLLLFYMDISEVLASILFFIFCFFLFYLRKKASALIEKHLLEDSNIMNR